MAVKDSFLCDDEVVRVKDYRAAHADDAVGKTIKPSLTLYANMEKEAEGRKEGVQPVAGHRRAGINK